MGTLSKAIGAYGGYLCASAAVIELIHNRARSFVYSTGLPPAIVGGRDRRPRPDRGAIPPMRRCRSPRRDRSPGGSACRRRQSPIVPLIVGDAEAALRGLAPAGGRRLPGHRHPAADRAGRHRAAALRLHGPASRRTRSSALPTSCATRILTAEPRAHGGRRAVAGMTAIFVSAHRDRCRQDLRHHRAHPAFSRGRPRGRCHQAGGERI